MHLTLLLFRALDLFCCDLIFVMKTSSESYFPIYTNSNIFNSLKNSQFAVDEYYNEINL